MGRKKAKEVDRRKNLTKVTAKRKERGRLEKSDMIVLLILFCVIKEWANSPKTKG